MIRIFVYLLAVLAVTALTIWLADIEGLTEVRIGDQSVVGPTAAFIGVALVAGVLLIFGTSIIAWLSGLPARVRRRRDDRQQERGMTALTRGLEAVAAGDADDAQRNAKLATRHLQQPALTRLLTAQAAHLAGDDSTARDAYAAMLEAPETEFLGLRGLYLQAMARGDKDEAKAYADRAFRLRPGAPWAFDSVYALSVERGAWGDAREALRLAHKQGIQEDEATKRKEAALLTAQGYAAHDSGDQETARKDAEAALKRSPGFVPAAVLAARLDASAGKTSKANKILDAAWAKTPHPAIARTMEDLLGDAKKSRRVARLRKLAAQNPEHEESRLLLAQQHIALGEYSEAKALLEPLLKTQPGPRTFIAMADLMEGQHGEGAGRPWRERAAAAPREPLPGQDGTFSLTTEGWRRLIEEYGEHGRLAPPPLEAVSMGLTEDELLRLSAPPAPQGRGRAEEDEFSAEEGAQPPAPAATDIVVEPAPADMADEPGEASAEAAGDRAEARR
ncbi:heme biosynthesis protein HemY [Parvularcula oceani]|uniref:heme biosynthesis protein HemY n=1 Tax=Parvularcula oceani TaxID=1247963 RepID=UPI0004E23199|nr:heme biosynthesis HemY N-terminal domain-containing protein [Parvularcula oceani]